MLTKIRTRADEPFRVGKTGAGDAWETRLPPPADEDDRDPGISNDVIL